MTPVYILVEKGIVVPLWLRLVTGVESVYMWEGKVETSAEELLIIKTRQSLLASLSAHVKANHPYE